MNHFKRNKKAYFFSLDAFIALLIIIGVVLIVKPPVTNVHHEDNLQEDLLLTLSTIQIGNLDNDLAKNLISSRNIINLNQSILEQIGEFYANSDPNAQALASSILQDLNSSGNLGIYFNNVAIASLSSVPYVDADTISTSRQIISGIQQGASVKGYSSRAFLFASKKVDYFYFGGYVGDGNISVFLGEDVLSANIEGAFSSSFSLYINNNFSGNYSPPKDIPYKISLSNYTSYFSSGNNTIRFDSPQNLYIAGGFIRATYNSYDFAEQVKTKYLPGVNGIINLYDSFFVPATLNTMEIKLHYNSSYDIFLDIGGREMYRGNSSGQEVNVLLNDSYLCNKWDPITCNFAPYNKLNERTVPLRLGLANASYFINISIPADVYSVNDLSGSMSPCTAYFTSCCTNAANHCETSSSCSACFGSIYQSNKIGELRNATKLFVDIVLNSSINRLGLVGYKNTFSNTNYHNISTNITSLKNEVNSWYASSSTCICCGVNKAVSDLVSYSNSSKSRSIVVMSDGQANVECSQQGSTPDLNGNGQVDDAGDDAIKATCDAFNNSGIVTYSIGFGSGVDEDTLREMALCTGGSYTYANVNELEDVYQRVANDVIIAAYQEQTITGSGFSTKLYPDSYIKLGYENTVPYGLIVFAETDTFNNSLSEGNYTFPQDSIPYTAKIVSYSGSKWTSKAEISYNYSGNWTGIFNLSLYGANFTNLGDPYMVGVPKSKLKNGNSTVRAFVSVNDQNYTPSSPYNKVIYSLVKNLSSYSPITAVAEGCVWHLQFEDETFGDVSVPGNYSGSDDCYYQAGNINYRDSDAVELAVYSLLTQLDLNSNGKIETKFTDNDLSLDTTEITGIPFTWETEVQVRSWR